MNLNLREITASALQLPIRERVRLAQVLATSVEEEVPLDFDTVWREEAKRRLADFLRDRSKAVEISVAVD
ncbi:MAG: addiction module protein, partial [Candidatus Hydrogenedentes bacterium]|nr:addiction module protein [Candidatus Hydrogenedentota bacterium]